MLVIKVDEEHTGVGHEVEDPVCCGDVGQKSRSEEYRHMMVVWNCLKMSRQSGD